MLKQPSIASGPSLPRIEFRAYFTYLLAFAGTLAVQTGHMAEHVTQVIQKFLIHSPAHGLVGRLDLEQVHFGFNTAYLVLMLPLLIGWFTYRSEISQTTSHWKALTWVFLITFLVQSYHQVEHTTKLIQYMNTHMQGTPGILGAHFDLVITHFVINFLVYAPLVVVFFGAGLHKPMLKWVGLHRS